MSLDDLLHILDEGTETREREVSLPKAPQYWRSGMGWEVGPHLPWVGPECC